MDPAPLHSRPSLERADADGSPTKRRRLDPQPTSAHAQDRPRDDSNGRGPTALRAMPVHLTLWALASSLRSSARQLLPLLAKRPSSTSPTSQQRYSHTWSAYVQQTAAAIAALRAAVKVTARTSETKGTRTELRAQAMLAEALIDTYEGTGDEAKIASEADGAITRALAISSSHLSLSAYTTPLTLLQLRLALAVNKPLKFIRTSLKRLIASLSPASTGGATTMSTPANLAATFHALAFPARFEPAPSSCPSSHGGASVAGSTHDALAAWRSVRELANETGQLHVWVVAALAETRLVLLTGGLGELSTVLLLLEALHPYLGVDAANPPSVTPAFPRSLQVMYRLLYCLVKSQTGDVKEAKAMLKVAHKMLDLDLDPVERAEPDRVRIPIVGSTEPKQRNVELAIQVPPHHVLYTFAFLVSSVVHFDPYGKNPRAILFAEEGIRALEGRLNGRETLPLVRSVAAISTHLRKAVPSIVRLHLNLASLATMRSSYAEAERHLLEAVNLVRSFASAGSDQPGMWANDLATDQILLGWAQVRIARAAREGADEVEAREALEAVLWRTENSRKEDADVYPVSTMTMTRRNAALAMLLLRLSDEGATSTFSASQDPVIRSLLDTIRHHAPSRAGAAPPSAATTDDLCAHSKLMSALASALTETTITASKTALSDALTLANSMQANYARVGILALLANVFLYTRDREAQKMLASALKLAQQMGAPEQRSCIVPTQDDQTGPVVVGNARLALWSGERLL
ncbi:hypothetical protein JCM3774_001824, partial [Rhodotorula dairenensis]